MKYTLHVYEKPLLYEIVYSGTTLLAIRRFYSDGQQMEQMGFKELPETVKKKIIKHLKEQRK